MKLEDNWASKSRPWVL